jgi:hypothetical protein
MATALLRSALRMRVDFHKYQYIGQDTLILSRAAGVERLGFNSVGFFHTREPTSGAGRIAQS